MTSKDEQRYRDYLDLLRVEGDRYAFREKPSAGGYRLLFCCTECPAEFDVTSARTGTSHREAPQAVEHIRSHGDLP